MASLLKSMLEHSDNIMKGHAYIEIQNTHIGLDVLEIELFVSCLCRPR